MRTALVVAFAGFILSSSGPALAESAAAAKLGKGRGSGRRNIDSARPSNAAPHPSPTPGKPKAPATAPQKRSHKRGKKPAVPSATLPEGAERGNVDMAARRGIAGGTPRRSMRATVDDPQLRALRDAERVLFPRRLSGFVPGWSWGETDPAVQASGLPPVVQALPSATLEDATHAEWLRSLTLPDFQVRLTPKVVEYLKFYRDTNRGRAIARVWARKVGRYTPAMQAEFTRAGLPRDLVWLSLIESGHDPTISSPAGAAGLWQFIPETARLYGLTVDSWVDERLDPQRSTEAAAALLADLYQRFGTWELAMAAYNMGHGGLLRSIRKYNTNDYWRLSHLEAALPWETSLYVPKVFAIAIVMNNRRAFGLDDIQKDPAITFDTVHVEPGVELSRVAKATGIPVESLRSMNPQYLRSRTPPSGTSDSTVEQQPEAGKPPQASRRWPLLVPRGLGRSAAAKLSPERRQGSTGTYVVRFGDTLDSVAARTRTERAKLLGLNDLVGSETLVPGTVLLVEQTGSAEPARDVESFVVVPAERFRSPGRRRVFYRVLADDTLASVSQAFGVTPRELVVWNGLDEAASLQQDMSLQVYVPLRSDLSRVRHVVTANTQVLRAGSRDFTDHFERLNGRKRVTVKARQGDTLSRIGRRYGLSAGMMERINHFSRRRKLSKGEPVVVYAQRGTKDQATDGKPLAEVVAPRPDALPRLGTQK